MASDDIGQIYKTQIPGYDDAADIQTAFRLYHYGTDTAPLSENDLIANSVAGHLKAIDSRVDELEGIRTGGDVLASEPADPADGYIWVDSTTVGNGNPIYATAVVSPTAPTTNLIDGVIWLNNSVTPVRTFVYIESVGGWADITETQSVIDAAGDIIYGVANNDSARLPIGTTGQILRVQGGLPAWTNEKSWILKSSGTLTGSSLNVSNISGDRVFIVLKDWSHDDLTDSAMISIRFNNDSGPNYVNTGGVISASSLHSPVFVDNISHDMTISVDLVNTAASLKPVSTIADDSSSQYFGYYKNTNPITSIQLFLSPTGSFDVGSYEVWSFE